MGGGGAGARWTSRWEIVRDEAKPKIGWRMAGWAQQNAIAASTVERHVRFTRYNTTERNPCKRPLSCPEDGEAVIWEDPSGQSIPQSAEGILHEMHRHVS